MPRHGLAVDGDSDRLAQVVANLLTNAAKYTEPAGHTRVAGSVEGGEAVLRVRDTGIGIAPDMLPRIFDLFVQERQALDRAQGGLGLGLAIVRSLVQLHGGRVEARSEGQGRGAEFILRLPHLPSSAVIAAPAVPSSVQAPLAAGALRKVLVVDDNQDAAVMLGDALVACGHTVRTAHDGPSALALADAFLPDVALLDIGLPVMDGFEVARRLRANPDLRSTRLVAVTGYGQEQDRQLSTAAGFAAHLVKPLDLQQLRMIVEEADTSESS